MPWLDRDDPEVAAAFAENRAASPRAAPGTRPPIELLRYAEMQARLDGRQLIRDVLEPGQISVVVGKPGTGKTYMVLDLGLCVATGRDWLGHRVAPGTVVYIAAEAGRSIANRVAAWRDDRKIADAPFVVIPDGLDLCHPVQGDLDRLLAVLADIDDLALVIIDTVSRVLAGGDENSPGDMGALVRSIDTIRDHCHCHVMAVHHLGKDAARGPRGHSLLEAAVDTMIEVTRDGATGITTAAAIKQRDLPIGTDISFRLRPVTLGRDADGDIVTSCVVDPAEATEKPKPEPRLSPAQSRALDLLRKAIAEGGTPAPASNHIPPSARCVAEEVWRTYCYSGAISAGDQAAQQKAFRRAAEALVASHRVAKWGTLVWLP